jgi:hypothetical protein
MVLDALKVSILPQIRLQSLISVNRRDDPTPERRGDAVEIAVRARTVGALFSPLDPSPVAERDLDPAVEAHVVGWARELPVRAALVLVIELPAEEAGRPEAAEIAVSFGNYFASRAAAIAGEQRELFRVGRLSLVIGTAVLVSCLLASQLLAPRIPNPTIARVLEESLILLGWVANWRPLEIYLYEWWPIRRRRLLHERLAWAPVVIRPV